MGKAYGKDVRRSILHTKKRFLSIMAITALGVTVLTGIYAACRDMYHSADRFYDEQGLFDVHIQSTLGLTQEDVSVLQGLPGVVLAEGGFSETVDTLVGGNRQTAQVNVLSSQGMNMPYVVEGSLPTERGEIAVTQKYLDDTGKKLGDVVELEEEEAERGEETEGETEKEIGKETEGEKEGEKGEETEEEKGEETERETEEETGKETRKETEGETETETGKEKETGKETEGETETDGEETETEIDWDTEVDIEEEEETPVFLSRVYTITGVVIDPMNISNDSMAFRSQTISADYTFFITAEDVDSDVYTSIYLLVDGMKEMDCYSHEYEAAVDDVIRRIENQIKEQREEARYESILREALDKIQDARKLMDEKFADADEQFFDAWEEIEDAKEELEEGERTLTKEERDALQKLAEARADLEDARKKLTEAEEEIRQGEKELRDGEKELKEGEGKLSEGKRQLEEGKAEAEAGFLQAEELLKEEQDQLDAARESLEAGVAALTQTLGQGFPQQEWNALAAAAAGKTAQLLAENPDSALDTMAVAGAVTEESNRLSQAVIVTVSGNMADPSELISNCVGTAIQAGILEGSQQVLNGGRAALEEQKAAVMEELSEAFEEIKKGEAQMASGRRELSDARKKLEEGKIEILDGWQELSEGEEELDREEKKALRELADAWQELSEGQQELLEGEEELIENQEEYWEKKKEAEQKIKDAYDELQDLDMAEWYVQDRDSLSSYSSLKSDMSSIESIGGVFPVLFLVVAILISLTTMTRMIEEERGLIGTYKALGFSDRAIYQKYIIYAFLACVLGGILGDLCGFIALPLFLISVLKVLYIIPTISLQFDVLYGVMGFVLFTVGIVAAAFLACRSELKQMPSALMRPKAPSKGSRVFLERVPFLWNRLKFLNKVTIRNLFRYKKRFFMTVFGIMGCTALVLIGFAIKDSVTDMLPKQYDRVYRYDMLMVVDSDDHKELAALLEEETLIQDYIHLEIGNYKVHNAEGLSESVQLMATENVEDFHNYIGLTDTEGTPVTLDETGIMLTQNAAQLLKVSAGDTVILENLRLERREVTVSCIVQNYLGNNVYMTQNLFLSLFGESEPNGALVNLTEECADHMLYQEELLTYDFMLSVTSIERLKAEFTSNFVLINTVVYLFIILAAGLAFVVLFTLSNTNISERMRELATTKVLGFYDREVHSYVNKETLILTFCGILLGLPVGRFLGGLLTAALKMPSMYFAVKVELQSYAFAAIISFCFALIVNQITNRTLNRINMVEALKSVE